MKPYFPDAYIYIQKEIVETFKDFHSLLPFAKKVLTYFDGQNDVKKYKRAVQNINKTFPNINIYLEKSICNYLFQIQFPFDTDNFYDSYRSLCGCYFFLNFIVIGYMHQRRKQDELVNVITNAFRIILHTNFTHNINVIFSKHYYHNPQDLERILTNIHKNS